MKNLLDDPEVMKLYRALQNKRYNDIEDYLNSSPIDEIEKESMHFSETNPPTPKFDRKIFWGGEEVSDFVGDNDYGL